MEHLVQSNTQFAIDLYKQLKTEKGNLFFSPYSISTAFALAYGDSRGETAKQMAGVFHVSLNNEELHSSFAELQNSLNAIQQKEDVQLSIANSLWPQHKYPFLKEYLELARKYYQTAITPVDYKNQEQARNIINAWVEEKTNNKIKNIIPAPPPPILTADTTLVLANAIYFKGDWFTKFDKSATETMPFYINESKSINVPMMHQTSKNKYNADENLQVLEMPYTGHELSMLIALPIETDGLHSLEEALTLNSLEERTKNLYMELIDVYLPRFKMTHQFDLKNALMAMGMKDAFVFRKADFSGMDGNPHWLYIGFAFHKAFVDVNEEGTEAAAATVGGCFPSESPVLTENGPVAIETVTAGAKVYSCDLVTGKWALTEVRNRQTHQYDGDMITIQTGHTRTQATGNHPFYVLKGDRLTSRPVPHDVPGEDQRMTGTGRWVEARDLKEGDVLRDRSGEGLVITGLSSHHKKP